MENEIINGGGVDVDSVQQALDIGSDLAQGEMKDIDAVEFHLKVAPGDARFVRMRFERVGGEGVSLAAIFDHDVAVAPAICLEMEVPGMPLGPLKGRGGAGIAKERPGAFVLIGYDGGGAVSYEQEAPGAGHVLHECSDD